MRSNYGTEHYPGAIPDGNERNGIARATQRVSGGPKSSRDNPGDGAAKFQAGWRAFLKRPDQGCQWDRSKEHYAEETTRRGYRSRSKKHPYPRLRTTEEQHRNGNRDRTKERKKDHAQFVAFSRPGRVDLNKRGAPMPITLSAKTSFTANHSR